MRNVGLDSVDEVSDRGATQVFSRNNVKHAVYVDNFAVASLDPDIATTKVSEARRVLEGLGLGCHEVSPGAASSEFTGLSFDGERRVIRVSSKRIWRLRLAIDFALGTGKASGGEIRKLIGHFTWAALLRRCLLSIFQQAQRYRFRLT